MRPHVPPQTDRQHQVEAAGDQVAGRPRWRFAGRAVRSAAGGVGRSADGAPTGRPTVRAATSVIGAAARTRPPRSRWTRSGAVGAGGEGGGETGHRGTGARRRRSTPRRSACRIGDSPEGGGEQADGVGDGPSPVVGGQAGLVGHHDGGHPPSGQGLADGPQVGRGGQRRRRPGGGMPGPGRRTRELPGPARDGVIPGPPPPDHRERHSLHRLPGHRGLDPTEGGGIGEHHRCGRPRRGADSREPSGQHAPAARSSGCWATGPRRSGPAPRAATATAARAAPVDAGPAAGGRPDMAEDHRQHHRHAEVDDDGDVDRDHVVEHGEVDEEAPRSPVAVAHPERQHRGDQRRARRRIEPAGRGAR